MILDSFSKGKKRTATYLKRKALPKEALPPAQCLKQQPNFPQREENQPRWHPTPSIPPRQAARQDRKLAAVLQPVFLSLSTCPPLNLTLVPVRFSQREAREEQKIRKELKNLTRKGSKKIQSGQQEMTSRTRMTPYFRKRMKKWEKAAKHWADSAQKQDLMTKTTQCFPKLPPTGELAKLLQNLSNFPTFKFVSKRCLQSFAFFSASVSLHLRESLLL